MTSENSEAPSPPYKIVLDVENLKTHFHTRQGTLPAVDDVSFQLRQGEILGLVGESGCGKSVTSLSILRLIPSRAGKVVGGSIKYGDVDLLKLSEKELLDIRGNEISMIFQEPMTALNPVMTVGEQMIESIRIHQKLSKHDARKRALEMLRTVKIPAPEQRIDTYPHELSGGMRQRIMIAMALSCDPKILIADEPTTALDVTIQAQIMDLLKEMQKLLGTAIIMITHDLGVIAEMADRVVVMYAGRIVEEAPVRDIYSNPLHPYTQGLMKAVPKLGEAELPGQARSRLSTIPGTVPALTDLPSGCAFRPRCSAATSRCEVERPSLEQKAPGHLAACWNTGPATAIGGQK
ncbi:ABC transporter ATP-binding protein [Sneathiella sp.]|uniref:ABC transporter ATP-binding protein n=1 Tax=Sneathiella sp. TaxID=1964365 RepID=UPI00356B4CFD